MALTKVLVVDDSSLVREMIASVLALDDEIEIAGQAGNGREAVEKVGLLKPDLVTMDIEMPVMNGMAAIEEIMSVSALPILVVSSRNDAGTAYDAMSKGALDVLSKSEIDFENPWDFINKVKLLSRVRVISHIRGGQSPALERRIPSPARTAGRRVRVVAIASSTGGPKALSALLPELPAAFPCPIVIAQHISDGFVPGMVQWLDKICKLNVKEAREGEVLTAGTVFISPSERHMKIGPDETVAFTDRKPKDIYHPSCDALLASVANVFRADSLGIILTGMGSDGAEGMKAIKKAGGLTIAQDEKSSAVFGMPRVAIESGCIDRVLPLEKMQAEIMSIVERA